MKAILSLEKSYDSCIISRFMAMFHTRIIQTNIQMKKNEDKYDYVVVSVFSLMTY